MEKSFGVVCEGPSDYRIIKRILELFFKGEDIYPTCYQPKQLTSGKSDYGGWSKVIENCSNNTIKEILDYNSFAIIQIDTDCSQDNPFNVSHLNNNGKPKSDEQLHKDVCDKIMSLITHEEKDRIILAICIHSAECWLLSICSENKNHTKNCTKTLNFSVQKKYKGLALINEKNKNQTNGIRTFDTIMSKWKNKKDISDSSKHNFGFKQFVDNLEDINKAM